MKIRKQKRHLVRTRLIVERKGFVWHMGNFCTWTVYPGVYVRPYNVQGRINLPNCEALK